VRQVFSPTVIQIPFARIARLDGVRSPACPVHRSTTPPSSMTPRIVNQPSDSLGRGANMLHFWCRRTARMKSGAGNTRTAAKLKPPAVAGKAPRDPVNLREGLL
jgi:hypothetical protein